MNRDFLQIQANLKSLLHVTNLVSSCLMMRAGKTLAVCNATGKVLDPLIIFQGKNFQSSWRGDMALPNTFYGVTINGWMETDVFADWADTFADENKGHPMLLL